MPIFEAKTYKFCFYPEATSFWYCQGFFVHVRVGTVSQPITVRGFTVQDKTTVIDDLRK